MAQVLIIYASRHGHTGKVALRLADQLRHHCDALVTEIGDDSAVSGLDRADAVIVAAPVYYSRHPRRVRRFVRRHVAKLGARPSAFVSVCGALAGQWDEGPAEARRYVEYLLELTGWIPRMVLSVAGALPYREYGLLTRWLMRRVSAWTGRPTDTSRNYEFTNWDDVDRFALEFAALLPRNPALQAAGSGPFATAP